MIDNGIEENNSPDKAKRFSENDICLRYEIFNLVSKIANINLSKQKEIAEEIFKWVTTGE